MYAAGSPPTATVVSLYRHSALHRKRGLGQSLSDLLDTASVALDSGGGSVTDVLSSLTGAASDYLAPSSPVTYAAPSTGGVSLPLILGGLAAAGGIVFLVTRKKRGASS